MIKKYIIKEDFVDCRLDKWIKKNVFQIPQSLLEKNIRKGKIKVNGLKQKSSYKLQLHDEIILYNFNPVSKITNKPKDKYKATNKEIYSSSKMIVEDNENFIVINKPAGISVQSGTKSKKNILDILSKTKYFEGTHPYAVHRIDKETTGVLIVAKNRKYAQLFTSLFRIRKIHKIYLGIVLGELEKSEGIFVDDLLYYEGKKKIISKAITHFKVLDSNNNYSFLKLSPITGRKHQLRKQLLMRNHPVIGDTKYRIFANNYKKKNNLMLHAYKINFSINGTKYKFAAEPPIYFRNTLREKYLKNF